MQRVSLLRMRIESTRSALTRETPPSFPFRRALSFGACALTSCRARSAPAPAHSVAGPAVVRRAWWGWRMRTTRWAASGACSAAETVTGLQLARMAAAASGPRKPGSPRDSESEVWSRRVRELVSSEPASRLCFECGQRGVTYVDITIGSFVCTGCSGALRGLNPPHRVKSISMTTFTESEVQFLQSRGNEACKKIWLGSFDSRTSLLPDSQDPQKVKEFLQEKYEKKRWYVSPEQAKGLASLTGQSSAVEAKTLLGDSRPLSTGAKPAQSTEKSQPHAPHPVKKASVDLLADFGGDPFAAPPSSSAFMGQVPVPTTFANFDMFGGSPAASAFGDTSASSHALFQSHPMAAGGTHMGSFPASPASQLGMDLSGTFRMGGVPNSVFGTLSQSPVLPPSSPATAYGACTNPFATTAIARPALPSTNPFQTNGLAPGTFAVGSPSSFSASPLTGVYASPLQQPLFPPQATLGQQQNGGGLFSGFPVAKAGQRPAGQPAGISTNPFVTPMPTAPTVPFALVKHPPTNPFL